MLIRIVGPLCAAIAGVAGAAACGGGADFTATGRCSASVAELRYDPAGTIEVEAGGNRVAWADTEDRAIDFDACPRVRTLRAFRGGTRYARTTKATTLHCRISGGFFVHVQPSSSSESGDFPDGSAVSLVVGPPNGRLPVAAAGVGSHAASLAFAPRYCAPKRVTAP